jgi:hypothetical protein
MGLPIDSMHQDQTIKQLGGFDWPPRPSCVGCWEKHVNRHALYVCGRKMDHGGQSAKLPHLHVFSVVLYFLFSRTQPYQLLGTPSLSRCLVINHNLIVFISSPLCIGK